MTDREVLDVRAPGHWEQWLAANHATASEVWVRLFNKAAGDVPLGYGEAVEIALCFGWIDSLSRRIDDDFFVQKFSRRTARSPWSKRNVEIVARLDAAGLLEPSGIATLVAPALSARDRVRYETALKS
jgi:uncharacterized protein YdeI (YjbR/CyaY-like superfamily)